MRTRVRRVAEAEVSRRVFLRVRQRRCGGIQSSRVEFGLFSREPVSFFLCSEVE
jgi:hypothetical protein